MEEELVLEGVEEGYEIIYRVGQDNSPGNCKLEATGKEHLNCPSPGNPAICSNIDGSSGNTDIGSSAETGWDAGEARGAELLGTRLELKWSSGKWYKGTICEFNPTKRRHKVIYDDGDLRWYFLPAMVYRFIKIEDEWVRC
mmetsp:Transcript_12544/g.22358  ORF Transcript_12544/g.22358 Transcript_12544/m.22358 type:complete len:141 (-) Transcript_12544:137-559(-)